MLASAGTVIPAGPEWAHEIKWDGMRVLADVAGGRLRLSSRNENDVTSSFPELSALAGPGLPADLLLDGEVVALEAGVPSFSALAERMHVSNATKASRLAATLPVTFMVFDLLRLAGMDLTGDQLAARRAALEDIPWPARTCRCHPPMRTGLRCRPQRWNRGWRVSSASGSRPDTGRDGAAQTG